MSFFANDKNCDSNDAHYCDSVKRKRKPTKRAEYAEITNIFEKLVVPRTKTIWRKQIRYKGQIVQETRDLICL